jgi:cyclase
MRLINSISGAFAATCLTAVVAAAPADRFAGVQIKAQHVGGSVHMLEGAGGNIGVSVGPDGTLIIDDQFAQLADKIVAAVDRLGGSLPKLVLNTHFHGDHTGGNPTFGETGTIIAHDNVRVRLLNTEDFPRSGLPLVTYDDDVSLHFNDEQIQLIHMPNGHTDGDTVVWFKNANVIHMGDQFFNGFFPFIDVQSDGTVDGYIRNIEKVVGLIPGDIKIIPGHGPLATVAELTAALAAIKSTSHTIREGLKGGKSSAAIEAELGEYAKWGSGFISTERWIEIMQLDAANSGR